MDGMNSATIDHLVVAADTLEQGVRWCEAVLGVTPGPGGRHPSMGTHNRLLRLASAGDARQAQAAYLEIIAIDPQAPSPAHPRWFGLDARRPGAPPQLVHWVLRVDALQAHLDAWRASGVDPGAVQSMSRSRPQDELRWRLTVPSDGQPGLAGALPALIEWDSEHPTAAMPPSGVALQALHLAGVPDAVWPWVSAPGVLQHGQQGLAQGAGPACGALPSALQAELLCPRGRIRLAGPPAFSA
jgi:hypothetical protein